VSNIWNLLPPAVVKWAKGILALLGAAAYVIVNYVPSLAANHYIAIAIGILTVLGVVAVPNSNARTEKPGGLLGPDGKPYTYSEKTLRPPTLPSGLCAPIFWTFSTGTTLTNVNVTGASGITYTFPGREDPPREPGAEPE
jgi:hypothetical protein